MFTQRHTAYKLHIKDLVSNPYIKNEGEVDYVEFKDLKVARARVMATIVNKMTFDNNSGFLVLDDGTETIRARVWENNFQVIDNAVIGDLVDIVGRVRQYNEETYIVPEIIRKASPDFFVLRKLELSGKRPKVKEDKRAPAAEKKEEEVIGKNEIYEFIKNLDKGEGAELKDVMSESGLKKPECLKLVRELMADGSVFEPKAEKFKVLE